MEEEKRFFFPPKLLFIIFAVLVAVNIAILDVTFINNLKSKKNNAFEDSSKLNLSDRNKESKNPSLDQSLKNLDKQENVCSASCLTKIYEATSSLKLKITPVSSNNTSINNATNNSEYFSVKEFFVPLGSGSNSTDEWADLSGAQAYIDSTSYGRVKSVAFEATVHIPTGNEIAYVRLFNATDKHPVWFSDVFLEGGTPQLLISKNITLDSGKKLYKVQMKTSLKYEAILDQARIHIATY